ncbi:MAG: flagellar motor protein MotB [Acidimicrobiales bacterium]
MSQPRKRKSDEHHEEGPSAERWLLTYSDMITLLMVLFIVLFALGQTDIRKFNAFKDSFHAIEQTQDETPPGGPGVLSQPSAIALSEQNPYAKLAASAFASMTGQEQAGRKASGQQANGNSSPGAQTAGQSQAGESEHAEAEALANAAVKMEEALARTGLAKEVSFNFDERGLVVSILTDKVLFPLDSAQLQPDGVAIINAIGPVLAQLPNQVDVEGDTDNQPIRGGPYADNWALSAARAVAVVEDLIRNHGIDPDRLQATGNSDTRPIVPNNTAQHQAENRRVQIVVFSTTVVTP